MIYVLVCYLILMATTNLLKMQYFLSFLFLAFSVVVAADCSGVSLLDLKKAQQRERSMREKLKEKKKCLPHIWMKKVF